MQRGKRVSDKSAALAKYEAVKGVILEKYDRFKHLLSWDEKQSLEELQNFSKEILESDVSLTVSVSDRDQAP